METEIVVLYLRNKQIMSMSIWALLDGIEKRGHIAPINSDKNEETEVLLYFPDHVLNVGIHE